MNCNVDLQRKMYSNQHSNMPNLINLDLNNAAFKEGMFLIFLLWYFFNPQYLKILNGFSSLKYHHWEKRVNQTWPKLIKIHWLLKITRWGFGEICPKKQSLEVLLWLKFKSSHLIGPIIMCHFSMPVSFAQPCKFCKSDTSVLDIQIEK